MYIHFPCLDKKHNMSKWNTEIFRYIYLTSGLGLLRRPPYKINIPTNKVFYLSATLTLWQKHVLCCCNLLLLGWAPVGGWAMCESWGDTRLCAEWNTLTPGLAANLAEKETRVEVIRVPGNFFQNKAHFDGSEQANEIHIYLLYLFSSLFHIGCALSIKCIRRIDFFKVFSHMKEIEICEFIIQL